MRCFSPSQWILRAVRSVLTRLSVMVLPKECVFSKSGGNLMGDLITVHTELKKLVRTCLVHTRLSCGLLFLQRIKGANYNINPTAMSLRTSVDGPDEGKEKTENRIIGVPVLNIEGTYLIVQNNSF
jgi:hypothetical protein